VANTFSALIPILYGDDQIVARELTGAVQSVKRDFSDQGAGLNQTIRVPIAPTTSVVTYTPAMTVTAGTDMTEGYADVVLQNNYMATFNLTGEQMAFLMSNKTNVEYVSWLRQCFQQAVRSVINQIETDLCTNIFLAASRATGTAATTPFGSNLTDAAKQRKILDDNGCPLGDRHLVIGTAAGLNLRSLTQLTNWLNVGDQTPRSTGALLDLFGIEIKESAQVQSHTAGTGANYVVNFSAGYAIGTTAITLGTGSGTILAGDIITFTGDTNNYVVTTALAANVVTIAKPGLRQTLANTTACTVGATYTANFTLQRDSTVAVIRPPIIPATPVIRMYPLTDPDTGLTLLVCECVGDGMITYRVHAVTGYKVVQPANVAILMG
jgi:hypothetical protein